MSTKESGMTLFELVIAVALLMILAAVVFSTINFKAQIDNGNDARRKSDLTNLTRMLDDFYNDKERYPLPSEICYDGAGSTTCTICGSEYTPPQFIPYTRKLPCDPQHDAHIYRYEVSDVNTPQWYRVFAKLGNVSDPQSCGTCGPAGEQVYSYGVSSSNKNLTD